MKKEYIPKVGEAVKYRCTTAIVQAIEKHIPCQLMNGKMEVATHIVDLDVYNTKGLTGCCRALTTEIKAL